MRKKVYSLILAGFIMVAATMPIQAAEIDNINGVIVEVGDSVENSTDDNSSEAIARGIQQRGSIIDTATAGISNLGKGNIGILVETLAHVECSHIKQVVVLERLEDNGKWTEVSRYVFDAKKEDFPTEDLSGMTNDFTVKNQKTGYYYRVTAVHYVEANGKGQSFYTRTDGIKITEYGD